MLPQLFLLDNLDLSQFNMKHDVLPRILAFDQVTLRRMTTMALDVGKYPPSYASCPICDLAQALAKMLFQLTTSINITNCSIFLQLRNASNVCYTRANFAVDDPQQAPTPLHAWRTNVEQFDQGSSAPSVGAAYAVARP
jgi:hypothetical protein